LGKTGQRESGVEKIERCLKQGKTKEKKTHVSEVQVNPLTSSRGPKIEASRVFSWKNKFWVKGYEEDA